jgi:hypothetical protein
MLPADARTILAGWANGSRDVILMAMGILSEFRKYDIPKR